MFYLERKEYKTYVIYDLLTFSEGTESIAIQAIELGNGDTHL